MPYRKRWRDEFDEFFSEFGLDIDRFNERIAKMWEIMTKEGETTTFGPYVYGFSYKIGPDGKPVFEEFGNVPLSRPEGGVPKLERDVREPITDITEDKNKVYITYELPGLSRENIDLNVSENNVTINVKTGPRKYYKSIDFEYDIKPETATAKFMNGMLDVSVERATKETPSGRKVKID